MLKFIGMILLISFTSNLQAKEYQVVVNDLATGEVQEEHCTSESELSDLTSYLTNLNDDSIEFSVKSIRGNIVERARFGGGEGGTD